jgi:uncharacterized membrane protein YebE (DUF533 family)
MFDAERLLGQMLGGSLGDAFGGKRGKKKRSAWGGASMATKAQVGVGLLGLAMAAWEHYKQQPSSPAGATSPSNLPPRPPAAPATPPPPPPAVPSTRPMPLLDERQQAMVLLIRAMIAGANADGHIDATERDTILARAKDAGLDTQTLSFLEAEIAKPATLQQVIANAKPELAGDTYAAAAMAISVDTEEERRWLDALALGIGLDPAVRKDIDTRLGI